MTKVENISNKVVGFGEVAVLPGETKEIPKAYEKSPVLEVYKNLGLVNVTVEADADEEPVVVTNDEDSAEQAEKLRQARLASLKGISEEDLCKLAEELEINPAECKDQADVLKKVKAALKK